MKKLTIPSDHVWCPLAGLGIEGACAEDTAIIDVNTKDCDKREVCIKIKLEMELNNESGNLYQGQLPVLRTGKELVQK